MDESIADSEDLEVNSESDSSPPPSMVDGSSEIFGIEDSTSNKESQEEKVGEVDSSNESEEGGSGSSEESVEDGSDSSEKSNGEGDESGTDALGDASADNAGAVDPAE